MVSWAAAAKLRCPRRCIPSAPAPPSTRTTLRPSVWTKSRRLPPAPATSWPSPEAARYTPGATTPKASWVSASLAWAIRPLWRPDPEKSSMKTSIPSVMTTPWWPSPPATPTACCWWTMPTSATPIPPRTS